MGKESVEQRKIVSESGIIKIFDYSDGIETPIIEASSPGRCAPVEEG